MVVEIPRETVADDIFTAIDMRYFYVRRLTSECVTRHSYSQTTDRAYFISSWNSMTATDIIKGFVDIQVECFLQYELPLEGQGPTLEKEPRRNFCM